MPSPQELLDFARELSAHGVEDLHLRLLSRQANAKKALLQTIDELVDASAQAQIVGLLRSARASDAAQPGKPRLLRAKAVTRRRTA